MSEMGSVVDISFPINALDRTVPAIPADHGYAMYSALSRAIPWVHQREGIGVHPVRGTATRNRMLTLGGESELTLRLETQDIEQVLPLSGKTIELDHVLLHLGIPTVRSLVPAATLSSRLVVIKGALEPGSFQRSAEAQLGQLDVRGRISIPVRAAPAAVGGGRPEFAGSPLRRTLQIRDKVIAGYALVIAELTAEESVRVQEAGIGGRRKFGCGVFVSLER